LRDGDGGLQPKAIFKNIASLKVDKNLLEDQDQCGICLLDFEEHDEVTPLPCDVRHVFHAQCVETWMNTKNTCPYCSKVIEEKQVIEMVNKYQENNNRNEDDKD
jgi:hypothetical protein